MKKELEQKLVQRWRSWFKVNGDPGKTRMAVGFAHGHGWFNIVWRLCEELEPLVAEAEKATGRPDRSLAGPNKNSPDFMSTYPTRQTPYGSASKPLNCEAIRTCEVCGKPGRRRDGDWIRTVFEHAGQ
jgi:hypothetical protein